MNYLRVYYAVIAHAAGRDPGILYEKHHIIPQSQGGPDIESNWIYLTPREHVVAHHCLAKAYPDNEKLNSGFNVNDLKSYTCYKYMMRIKDLANSLEASKKKLEIIEKIEVLCDAVKKLNIQNLPVTKTGDGKRIRRNAATKKGCKEK